MKVKIITTTNHSLVEATEAKKDEKYTKIYKSGEEALEIEINKFLQKIEGADIIDIKYNTVWQWLGNWEDSGQMYSAMIIYE